MKKLLFILLGTIVTQFAQSQAPFNTPDNSGAGNCLSFDGVNDYVSIPDHNSLDFITKGTIEAWVKTSVGLFGGAIAKGNFSGSTSGFLFQQNTGVYGGRLRVAFYNGGAGHCQELIGNTPVTDGEWHHVAVTWDGTTIQIFMDGKSDGSAGQSCNYLANNEPLIIGARNGPGDYWDGAIEEVRMWNIARTQAQIRENMCETLQGNETGLVGYWNMNEGTGNTVNDLTVNGNDGTLQ